MDKRLSTALLTGSVLGIFCILGAGFRLGFDGNALFLTATWFNRLVMGLVIGYAPQLNIKKDIKKVLLRGAILGLIISFSLYIATDFRDMTGFIAGIIYGVIIDYVATRYSR
ncbi:hypothetical protein KY362_01985 [Candidatus Woesearchaeota archaeon]|nr:hypothetical protein [Candidatus Woesearchaeota archaeon]